MVKLEITLDSQTFTDEDFAAFAEGSVLISVSGIVNRRWEEFSAWEAAERLGLRDVYWDYTSDNTPGSLTFLFGYSHRTKAQLEACLRRLSGIDFYRLYTLDWPEEPGV